MNGCQKYFFKKIILIFFKIKNTLKTTYIKTLNGLLGPIINRRPFVA